MPMPPMSHPGPGPLWPINYGPAPIPLRKEPHIPLTPKTGMRREEIERRIAEAGVTAEEKAAWNAKYQKPSTGIPKTDLASGVQASLGKADTALQEHQSLDGYATEEWVADQGYLTEHQDITGKVDKSALFDNPDTTPKVKPSLLPSYVDDVLEFASLSVFPTPGETGKIYVALDTNKTYRWGGTQYVQVGGDEQAQADWSQTDSDAPDFIKNKPTIPDAQIQSDWNQSDTTAKDFIKNKPTIPAAQVNADWNASSGAAQILNKPTIPTVPTNVSAFTNDAGYLTQHQSLSAYRTAAAQDEIDDLQDDRLGLIELDVNDAINRVHALEENEIQAASIAPAFDHSSTYAVGDYCTHEGLLYKCTTAVSTAGAWNAANWTQASAMSEMPAPGASKNVWYGSTPSSQIGRNFTATTTSGDFVLSAGNVVVVRFDGALVVSSNMTLNVDGTGAKAIRFPADVSSVPEGYWKNLAQIAFAYDGSRYRPISFVAQAGLYGYGLTKLTSTVDDTESLAATPKAVNTRAPKDSPAFTGTPTAPTANARTNTTQVATTEFVQTAVGGKLDATERNYLAYSSTTTLDPATAVYRSSLNADGTFPTITDSGIPTAAAYYQFELELTVPSTVPATIYGPTMGGAAFDSTASYAVGDYVVYDNVEYACVTAHTGAWDASHFKQAWVFLDSHGLPDPADLSGGETICISVRLDCTARTFLASVWRVA